MSFVLYDPLIGAELLLTMLSALYGEHEDPSCTSDLQVDAKHCTLTAAV
jgi:hypothetical protein